MPKVLSFVAINDSHKFPISKVINGNISTFWCIVSHLRLNLIDPYGILNYIFSKTYILNILCVVFLMPSTKKELSNLAMGVTECATNLIILMILRRMPWSGFTMWKAGLQISWSTLLAMMSSSRSSLRPLGLTEGSQLGVSLLRFWRILLPKWQVSH